MVRDLRKGPVAVQVQIEYLTLMVRKQRSVALEKGQEPAPRLKGVKCHTLTGYQTQSSSMFALLSRIAGVDSLWIETFRYNKWANLHLLNVCEKLPEEQLQLTAPGTYGTVATTWQHLLSAEQRYLKRLSDIEPVLNERDAFPGIAVLKGHAARSGDQLIEAARQVKPDDAIEAKFQDGTFRLHLGVVIIQALHHGNDHRTHVCTILGHHGIGYGDMDVWAYGEATGATVPIPG